jgi:hypothetical protein
MPSNTDGIAERNGHFLVIETKTPNDVMSYGQSCLLWALSRLPEFTVLTVWVNGDLTDSGAVDCNPTHYERYLKERVGDKEPIDVDGLREIIEQWYREVDAKEKPCRR